MAKKVTAQNTSSATPPTPDIPSSFRTVFEKELEEIGLRREHDPEIEIVEREFPDDQPPVSADPSSLVGLALSGGGIRSATLSLGVLQALNKVGLLRVFDYLSTVSGGGFTGAWWSAWTSRNPKAAVEIKKHPFFPPEETISQQRVKFRDDFEVKKVQTPLSPDQDKSKIESKGAIPPPDQSPNAPTPHKFDPIHHLRLFSNYLTPIKGFLSGEAWTAATIVSRNLILTWLVLIPILFAAVLTAQLWFTLQPHADWQFLFPYARTNGDVVLKRNLNHQQDIGRKIDNLINRRLRNSTTLIQLDSVALDSVRGWIDSIEILNIATVDTLRRDHSRSRPLAVRFDTSKSKRAASSYPLRRQEREIEHYYSTLIDPTRERGASQYIEDSRPDTVRAYRAILERQGDNIRTSVTEIAATLTTMRWDESDKKLFADGHDRFLRNRIVWALYIPIGLVAWLIALTILWMLTVSSESTDNEIVQSIIAFIGGAASLWLMSKLMPTLIGGQEQLGWDWNSGIFLSEFPVWVLGAAYLLWWALSRKRTDAGLAGVENLLLRQHRKLEYRRVRILSVQQSVLIALVASMIFLAFGGFGHEVISYLLYFSDSSSDGLVQIGARVVSFLGTLSAVLGAAALAWRGFSVNRTDPDKQKTTGIKIVLLKVVPPLLLLVLLSVVSWLGHQILAAIVFDGADSKGILFPLLQSLAFELGLIAIFYAWTDMNWRGRAPSFNYWVLMLIAAATAVTVIYFPELLLHPAYIVGVAAVLGISAIIRSTFIKPILLNAGHVGEEDRLNRWHLVISLLCILAISSLGIWQYSQGELDLAKPAQRLFFICVGFITFLLALEFILQVPQNRQPRGLAAGAILLTAALFGLPAILSENHVGVTYIVGVLITLCLEVSIVVGWRVNPNALSLHAFYRSRLIRAYLGASNPLRSSTRREIDEFQAQDDIPLCKLGATHKSAPYHIINTTLNELGGNALNSAQRHASHFLLSTHYCGSTKTGYRPTTDYMNGDMTLGTAAAISGAATTPALGNREISGAVAMLMSLMNVRLGFWAPNPKELQWREARPKVWPYYLLKESFRQTSDLGEFCYLSDGGHFDNTGLYALVQRGCKCILLCDNSADGRFNFEDIGTAIRRTRIDFRTEIELDELSDLLPASPTDGKESETVTIGDRKPWLCGKITYNPDHLRLVWGREPKPEDLNGHIIVFKPMVPSSAPADIVQYDRQNKGFPHQSDADQWFDETQFESYRKLGEWIASQAFPKVPDASRAGMRKQFSDFASAQKASS